mmetsp:Transcript_5507/g.16010  ORF Transcript_5507/g.16010 Transcript_5507/m.16010 type:complete len:110 (-) Transcript_5507:120-449(-)
MEQIVLSVLEPELAGRRRRSRQSRRHVSILYSACALVAEWCSPGSHDPSTQLAGELSLPPWHDWAVRSEGSLAGCALRRRFADGMGPHLESAGASATALRPLQGHVAWL